MKAQFIGVIMLYLCVAVVCSCSKDKDSPKQEKTYLAFESKQIYDSVIVELMDFEESEIVDWEKEHGIKSRHDVFKEKGATDSIPLGMSVVLDHENRVKIGQYLFEFDFEDNKVYITDDEGDFLKKEYSMDRNVLGELFGDTVPTHTEEEVEALRKAMTTKSTIGGWCYFTQRPSFAGLWHFFLDFHITGEAGNHGVNVSGTAIAQYCSGVLWWRKCETENRNFSENAQPYFYLGWGTVESLLYNTRGNDRIKTFTVNGTLISNTPKDIGYRYAL